MGDLWMLASRTTNWEHLVSTEHSKIALDSVPSSRYGHIFVAYHDYLILFGGEDNSDNLLSDLWIYSIQSKAWTFIKN